MQEAYMEKAHRILFILLSEIDRVCKKYGLKYYLICGGLIGAVRHKNFIPWDDDIDVAMTREDFDKLKKIAKKEWRSGSFLFVDYNQLGNGAFLDYMTRVIYMDEEIPINVFRKIRGKGRSDIDNHMPLDIYVLDKAPKDEKKFQRLVKCIQGLYGLGMAHRAYINYDEYSNTKPEMQKKIKLLTNIGKYIPLWLIVWVYELVRKSYRHLKEYDYFQSNGWILCIPWRFKREWFEEGAEVEINGTSFMAPKMYDEFLRFFYGDYMKLPPEEKRKPTHAADASGIFH